MKLFNVNAAILTGFIFIFQIQATAQSASAIYKQNQLYLELGGNGLFYSLSYERMLSENLTLRGGFGITPGLILADGTFIHIPITASFLEGNEHSKFEVGLGATYLAGTDLEIFSLEAGNQSMIFLTGIIGYRYTSSGGFVFRVIFTPMFSTEADPYFYPSFGLSFGFML